MDKKIQLLITADSVCDLPEEVVKKYNIVINYYRIQTNVGRFVDGVEIDTNDLLNHMEKYDERIKSEPPSVEEYKNFFMDQLARATHIIHFTMGKNASEGYDNANEAARNLHDITVVDSGQLSSGMGLLVIKAAKMVMDGKDIKEIVDTIDVAKKEVHTSFVVKDTEFLYRSGRLSRGVKKICDRLLLHPMLKMKKSKIVPGTVWMGQWKRVIDKYIDNAFSNVSNIDTDILFITHAKMDYETLEYIKQRVEKKCKFKEVYIQKASSAIACNCGKGTFGLLYLKKFTVKKKEYEEKKNIFSRIYGFCRNLITNTVLKEEYEIKHKLLNLILMASLVGGSVAAVFTLFMGAVESFVIILALLMVVYLSLYISIRKNKPKIASLFICFLANVILLPLMFFKSGGLYSGMPVWFVLGLIFAWLLLDGWLSYAMYSINLVAMITCILYADKHTELLTEMSSGYMVSDIIQTIIFVSCIFGVIFRYQAHVYETQKSQLEEHEKELLAANNAKSTFLANMSHEIRTPINGIIGMDTMLLKECRDNEVLSEYGKNIQSASQTLLSLVNDILDISKIESGKLEIIPVDYELFSILNDCYNMTAVRAAENNLEFILNVNPNIPSGLFGDEVRVRQIINNLLSNAVKYTEKGTVELIIDYEMKSDASIMLIIKVKDTGIGIKEEDMDKLFENFTRVDEKKNRNIEGTGLGLNLTRNLVEMMGGSIDVESVYEKGSVFTARVHQIIRNRQPMGDFSTKYQQVLKEENDGVNEIYLKDARLLVVDDVPMNLLVAKGLMKYTGATIDTAESAQAALELIEKVKYDIIFLDHLMPVMDGIECFHRMKEMKDNINITTPVIILTANAIMGAREEYLNIGFTDYLAKPIQESELMNMLIKYMPEDKISYDKKEAVQKENIQKAGQPDEEEKNEEDPLKILEKTGMVNIKAGLGFCMEDVDFYMQILEQYYEDNKGERLEKYYESKDWENYRITVHSIKSTSLTLGAEKLSEMAKASEMACKENNISYVEDNHRDIMEMYVELRTAIEKVMEVSKN